MSALVRTPVTRVDGVQTNVWKRQPTAPSSRVRSIGAPQNTASKPRLSIDAAIAFDPYNTPDLPKPEWWGEFYRKSMNAPDGFKSEPKLLDIIPYERGNIAVVWQPVGQDKRDILRRDSGHIDSSTQFYDYETRERLGTCRVSKMTDESLANAFGDDEYTVFRWRKGMGENGAYYADINLGFQGVVDETFEETSERPADTSELDRELWYAVHRDYEQGVDLPGPGYNYVNHLRLTREHIPADIAQVRADLDDFRKRAMKDLEKARSKYPDDASYVDVSAIDGAGMRGKGYGTAIYIYTAKQLATEGRALLASSSQSEYAEKLWARLEKNFPENVKDYTYGKGKKHKSKIFDFR